MTSRVELEFAGRDAGLGKLLEKQENRLQDLERLVARLSGKPLDIPTDPTDEGLEELQRELRRLEAAFDRAERSVSFKRTQNELEKTERSARQLSQANLRLATSGRQLIDFAKRLPPELQRGAGAMDRLEKETEQATAAFRTFQATANTTGRGMSQLVSSIGQLRTGLGALVAALGVQQLIGFGRRLVTLGQEAVATKIEFDRLIPTLKAFAGSTDAAQEVAGKLEAIAAELKTPVSGLIQPFLRLNAAVKETNLTQTEQIDLFESALLTTRAFGLSVSETSRLITGFAQVAGKGTLQAEELRQQIGEVAFNALPALAKELKLTTGELLEQITNRAVDAETALRGLADGLRAANEEAGRANVDLLVGDVDNLRRVAEAAQRELGDGLEPGLRDLLQAVTALIEQNPVLIRQLGELGSAGLSSISELVEQIQNAARGFQGIFQDVDQAGLAAFLDILQRLDILSEDAAQSADKLVDALAGIPAQAREDFAAADAEIQRIVTGIEGGALKIQEAYAESFAEAAQAAGLAAEDIEATQKTLAARIGEISERSVDRRAQLEERAVEARRRGAANIEEVEARLAQALFRIRQRDQDERIKLLDVLVEETRRAAERRIEEEQRAATERDRIIGQTIDRAREVAQERIAIDEQAASRIEEIERQLAERVAKARADAAEKLAQSGADREKVLQELLERIVELERDAASKIRAEQERIAKAAEASAERRRKAEEKVQDAYQKSIERLRDLVVEQRKLAEGEGEDGGGAFEKQTEQVENLIEKLDQLQERYEELLNPETLGEDPGEILENAFSRVTEALDLTVDGFEGYFDVLEQGQDATRDYQDRTQDLIDALEQAADANRGLQGAAQESVSEIIRRYADLADSGRVTSQDVQAFTDEIANAFQDLGVDLGSATDGIREKLREVADAQQEVAEGASDAGQKQEKAAQGASVEWDELTQTLRSVEEGTEGVAGASEEATVRLEEVEGVVTVTNEALRETADNSEAAGEGLQTVGEKAGEGAEGLQALSEAADAVPDQIIAPEQPETLRQLGAAAGEAGPPIVALAEPTAAIAQSATSLQESLPVIAAQLPPLAESLSGILAALAENPVDIEGLASELAIAGEGLAQVATQLERVGPVLETLPERLTLVNEQATPLLESVLAAADDDRIGRLATATQALSEGLAAAETPIATVREQLDGIADRAEDVHLAVEGTTERLRNLGSEDTTSGIETLFELLKQIAETMGELDGTTQSVLTTAEGLEVVLPKIRFELDSIGGTLNSTVIPAFQTLRELLEQVKARLDEVRQKAGETSQALQEMADAAVAGLNRVVAKLQEVNRELDAAIEKTRQLKEEMAGL